MTELVVRNDYARLAMFPSGSAGMGPTSDAMNRIWTTVGQHISIPLTRQKPSVEEQFLALADEWKSAALFSSFVRDMALEPSYQRIIGLGQEAVPFLLREMESDPDHWDWALAAMTGANPVPEEHAGNLERIAEAWVRWGRDEGYVW